VPAASAPADSDEQQRAGRLRPLAAAASMLAAALVLAIGGALVGCGSSSGGTNADPARVVPATATLYAAATVRPGGSLKSAALSAGRSLTRKREPYVPLVALLRTPGSPALDYSRDVAPWLGERAGMFTTQTRTAGAAEQSLLGLVLAPGSQQPAAFPFGSRGAQGAIALDTSNAGKARSFLDSQASRASAHSASYRGVTYQLGSGGVAFAMVKQFAVIGSESGVRQVIETSAGGASLARAGGYGRLLAAAPSGTLAHVYSNQTSFAQLARPAPGAAAPLERLLAGPREANISLVPGSASIALDADVAGSPSAGGGLLAAMSGGAQPFSELPGDSWLALGLGDVGATLSEDVAGLRALLELAGGAQGEGASSSGLNLQGIAQALFTPLAVLAAPTPQARHAFTSWMGSGGIFAGGGSVFELHAAVVIDSKDPTLSRAAVARLGAALRAAGDSVSRASIPGTDAAIAVRVSGLPLALDIADGRDSRGTTKFVLGLGESSVAAALHPQSTLSSASSTSAAGSALGEGMQPNLLVNVPTIVDLLESVGLTGGLSGVLPYLHDVGTVSGGTRSVSGGIQRVRVVATLRQSEG
jgi:Protein of unknown function (DUF3352)